LEKLSQVKLLEDAWHTAPNHSRPASCVVDADIDAGDQPERNPQKGQWGSWASSSRAIVILKVAIEFGLCRSGRTRRAARPEGRRRGW
jgi:hypothetical protein